MGDEAQLQVVLIDDGLGDRSPLAQALGKRGYRLFLVGPSPASIAQLIRERKPHVLVLDMTIRDVDVVEVLLAVRRIDATLPVIVINASASATTVLKTLTLGHCDYLFRPFDTERLVSLINANAIRHPAR